MPDGGKTPERLRKDAMSMLDTRVVHLETEAQNLIKLLSEALRRLKVQMFEGLNYKGDSVRSEDLRALKDITAAFNSATDAQIRLDKTAEVRKNAMTHEEQKQELATWVLSWPSTSERANWIRDLARSHDTQRTGGPRTTMNSVENGPTLAGVRDSGDEVSS